MRNSARKVTIDDVWRVIEEIGEAHKKTELQAEKTARQAEKTERQAKKTERQLEKTIRSLEKSNNRFNNRWGKFIENLISGDLVALLLECDIKVDRLQPRMVYPPVDGRRGGEFDLVAVNGKEVVIVEVKSTLEKVDIDEFMEKIKIFRKGMHEFKDKVIYGAVAYLDVIKRADEYADSQGLFVIKACGGKSQLSTITNDKESFRPKAF